MPDRVYDPAQPDGSGMRGGLNRPLSKRAKKYPYDKEVFYGQPAAYDNKSVSAAQGHQPPVPKDTKHTAWEEADEAFDAAMSIHKSDPGGGAPVVGAAGSWATSPIKPWDHGEHDGDYDDTEDAFPALNYGGHEDFENEENEQIAVESLHLESTGVSMTLDEIRQIVDLQLSEARKSKKKKKEEKEDETPGFTYAEAFDFSKPLGDLNLYKQQGGSSMGPNTASNWPVLESIIKGNRGLPQPKGVWESLMFAAEASDESKKKKEPKQDQNDADDTTQDAEDADVDPFSEVDPKTAHKKGQKDPKALAAHIKKKKAGPKKEVDEAEDDDLGGHGSSRDVVKGKTTAIVVDAHGRVVQRGVFDPRAFGNKKLCARQPAEAGQEGQPWPKGYQLRVTGPDGEERYEQF